MRYIKYLSLFLVFMCTNLANVYALSCPGSIQSTISSAANHVKVSYEVIDNSKVKELEVNGQKTTYKIPNYTFEISIYNITPDIYVKVKDSNREFNVYNSSTKDGVYTFTNSDFGTIHTYTFEVNSANSNCYGKKFRTIKLVQPMYNAYSEFTYCKNNNGYYCQKFTTTDLKISSTDDFLSKIKANNDKLAPGYEQKKEKKAFWEMIKSNWKLYLGLFFGIIGLVILIIFIIKKRQKNKEWRL